MVERMLDIVEAALQVLERRANQFVVAVLGLRMPRRIRGAFRN